MSLATIVRRSDEERAAIAAETTWVPLEPAPPINLADAQAIASGQMQCPHCYGGSFTFVPARGETTGVVVHGYYQKRCNCVPYRLFYSAWTTLVPERFQGVNLQNLQPQNKQQAQIIALMREHTSDSYFLYGPPGTGKTHLSFGLFHAVLKQATWLQASRLDFQPYVWRKPTSVLLQEHVDYECSRDDDDVVLPTVTEKQIRNGAKKGYCPALFLDEIDKFPPSEFKLDRLAELVNAVYEVKGQVVATSNLGLADLEKKWGAAMSGTILRRIGSDGGHAVRFGG